MIDRAVDIRRLDSRRKKDFFRPRTGPRLISVGTATPPRKYTQEEVLGLFRARAQESIADS